MEADSQRQTICNRLSSMRNNLNLANDVNKRLDVLKRLKDSIRLHISDIEGALWNDLHKSAHESYLTEMSVVTNELNTYIRHLKKWAKPEKVTTPYFLLPSKSRILKQPYGLVLIMAPWNYPFQLNLLPLIGAIAAGNSVVLKPSPDAQHTADVVAKIVDEVFDKDQVAVFHGDIEVNQLLLDEPFDYIFFTGSPHVGQIVMQAAAKHLTPVTLELGGKSPCIVTPDADVEVAAKRIVWGKFINAGQTCVAPDYVLVHEDIKDALLSKMKNYLSEFYGDNPRHSPDLPRIVNTRSVQRLRKLMDNETIFCGGDIDVDDLYIAPTILADVDVNSPVMKEEIFGPILPILTFGDESQAVDYINNNPKPLALYYFGRESKGRRFLTNTSSGGACINDVILHLANSHLPFGGVGQSGMGSYHGRVGFDTFSHRRAVLISKNWFDLFIKYPPYRGTRWLKKMM